MDESDRLATINRLKEHVQGPLDDGTRAQIMAALEQDKRRSASSSWRKRFIDRLRGIK